MLTWRGGSGGGPHETAMELPQCGKNGEAVVQVCGLDDAEHGNHVSLHILCG